jgi:hypothetical protein
MSARPGEVRSYSEAPAGFAARRALATELRRAGGRRKSAGLSRGRSLLFQLWFAVVMVAVFVLAYPLLHAAG